MLGVDHVTSAKDRRFETKSKDVVYDRADREMCFPFAIGLWNYSQADAIASRFGTMGSFSDTDIQQGGPELGRKLKAIKPTLRMTKMTGIQIAGRRRHGVGVRSSGG